MCAKTAETGARGQRGLILMQFVYCGFVDADTPFASNLQLTSLYDTAHVLQAVPGGWGYVLLIADSCSCPGKRVLHDVTAAGLLLLLLIFGGAYSDRTGC